MLRGWVRDKTGTDASHESGGVEDWRIGFDYRRFGTGLSGNTDDLAASSLSSSKERERESFTIEGW